MLEAGEDDDFEVSVRAPYMLNLKFQTRYLGFRIQYNLHETGFEQRTSESAEQDVVALASRVSFPVRTGAYDRLVWDSDDATPRDRR